MKKKKLKPKIKHVFINGYKWKVIFDPELNGGKGDTFRRELKIGTMYPEFVPEFLLHEVFEVIMQENHNGYSERSNGSFMYVMPHKDFQRVVVEVSGVLKQLGVKFPTGK